MEVANAFMKLPIQSQAIIVVGSIAVLERTWKTYTAKDPKIQGIHVGALISSLLFVILAAYNANCLLTGGCNMWANVVAFLYVCTTLLMMWGVNTIIDADKIKKKN